MSRPGNARIAKANMREDSFSKNRELLGARKISGALIPQSPCSDCGMSARRRRTRSIS